MIAFLYTCIFVCIYCTCLLEMIIKCVVAAFFGQAQLEFCAAAAPVQVMIGGSRNYVQIASEGSSADGVGEVQPEGIGWTK